MTALPEAHIIWASGTSAFLWPAIPLGWLPAAQVEMGAAKMVVQLKRSGWRTGGPDSRLKHRGEP